VSGDDTVAVLHKAAAAVGLDSYGAEVIRFAENAIYLLPGRVVARIGRPGQATAAAKEVNVARWLEDSGVAAVRILRDVDQPVLVDDRAVTFWHELPPHEKGTLAHLAAVLRQLHSLPLPTGFDVTTWSGFSVLRDIRELRWTTFAAQHAASNPERYADQAAHRLACLRGERGPRPWSGWRAVP
jgi:hypothetical protein